VAAVIGAFHADVAHDGFHASPAHTVTAGQASAAPQAQPTAVPPASLPGGTWAQPPTATPWPQPSPATADVLSQYRPAQRRPSLSRTPRPTVAAARLMYAGAVASLLYAIVALAVVGQVKAAVLANDPQLSARAVRSAAAITAAGFIVGGAVSVALWLWMASATRHGRSWVRPVGTVLFAINTLTLVGPIRNAGLTAIKGIGVVIWLIGLATVISLWLRRRQPGDYVEASR
jgi:hypothetical protein